MKTTFANIPLNAQFIFEGKTYVKVQYSLGWHQRSDMTRPFGPHDQVEKV